MSLSVFALGYFTYPSATTSLMDVVLPVLSDLGLRGEEAIHAARSLRAMLHGFVLLEAGGGFGLPVRSVVTWRLSATLAEEGQALSHIGVVTREHTRHRHVGQEPSV